MLFVVAGFSWHRLPEPSWAHITGRFRAALMPLEVERGLWVQCLLSFVGVSQQFSLVRHIVVVVVVVVGGSSR